jgi:hypothetical protein
MCNKGDETGSLIRLPTGGGALSGLGEKFSPDLHTGTANFSIPLALPAGRNGFQPQLALSYSTGQGQSLFGLGWALSLPGVSRKRRRGYRATRTLLCSRSRRTSSSFRGPRISCRSKLPSLGARAIGPEPGTSRSGRVPLPAVTTRPDQSGLVRWSHPPRQSQHQLYVVET